MSLFLLCLTLATLPSSFVFAKLATSSTEDQKAQLQNQLQQLERQITQYEPELKSVRGDKRTLQKKIK
jgi:septal ring factor EnvC (AmiA/AmiB activator)